MKNRLLPSLILFAVFLASCAPAASTVSPAPTDNLPTTTPVSPSISAQPESASTETPVPVIQPVATSRGPDLEATDPATVNLASGQLQLVEFFRFT